MKKAFAIHEIQHRIDGKLKVEKPGTVFSLLADEFNELLPLGAVREPTETELMLAKLAAGGHVVDAEHVVREPTPAPAPTPAEPAAAGGPVEPEDNLTLEHKGNGKFVVLKGAEVISGEDLIQGKAAAQEFLDDYRAKATAAANVSAEPDLLG